MSCVGFTERGLKKLRNEGMVFLRSSATRIQGRAMIKHALMQMDLDDED
jgi:hypothetical protein